MNDLTNLEENEREKSLSENERENSTEEGECPPKELKQKNLLNILKDFINDIILTFPERNNDILRRILDNDDEEYDRIKKHCESVYPEKFFDILYQNENIFEDENKLYFLPNIDFCELWKENITEKTKDTIWKYLQLILFTIVEDLPGRDSFGTTKNLFEAINKDEFKEKLEETISNIEKCFANSDSSLNGLGNDIDVNSLPSPEKVHEHVESMMEGKLGQLAKEIAEETAKDMKIEEAEDVNDIFKNLLKNPAELMRLVKKVGGKLDDKIKTGEIKESELLEEAGEMVKKMKNMPGMGNLNDILGKMGKNGKMDMSGMQSQLKKNLQKAKQVERMRKKQEENKSKGQTEVKADLEAIEAANKMAMELLNELEGKVEKVGERSGSVTKPNKKKKKKGNS